MAGRAAGRVGEVLLAIGVTAQAHVVPGAGHGAVPGVTTSAGGVLLLLVQTAQLGALVASGAGGRRRDACGTVRAVAISAGRPDFSVLGLRLAGVAFAAGSGSARA